MKNADHKLRIESSAFKNWIYNPRLVFIHIINEESSFKDIRG